MMVWPSWLWITSPLKFWLWLGNRFATWSGALYLWRRFRARRDFWVWMVLLNVVSFAALGCLFFWLHVQRT